MPNGEAEKKDALRNLGAQVRARREELGMSLENVSDRTRIRVKYLTAVEEGDDSVSPGKTYFRAFLKTYASFLGLDGSEFSNRYKNITEGPTTLELERPRSKASSAQVRMTSAPAPTLQPEAAPSTSNPVVSPVTSAPAKDGESAEDLSIAHRDESCLTPAPSSHPRPARPSARRRRVSSERRRKNGAAWVFIALVAIAAVAYVAFFRQDTSGQPGGTSSQPTGGQPTGGINTPAGNEPTIPSGGTEPEPPAPKVQREDPNKEKTVWSVDRTPVEVVLKLGTGSESVCWVSVQVDGKPSFEKTLTAGEEVKLSAKSEIVIRAGKPWVVNVTVNGQDVGVAGEVGPVKDLVFRSTVSS